MGGEEEYGNGNGNGNGSGNGPHHQRISNHSNMNVRGEPPLGMDVTNGHGSSLP